MNMSRWYSCAIATLLISAAPVAAFAQHEHEGAHQAHETGGAMVGQLQLDHDKKWPTDASLRSGMANIRTAFEADHAAIHAGKESDAAYATLADRIEQDVNRIVANCRLPPAADAQLHLVVADLLQGVGLMRGGDPAWSRHDGAALVHGALNAYGKYFDDAKWSQALTPTLSH